MKFLSLTVKEKEIFKDEDPCNLIDENLMHRILKKP
jgi:hypothetical protein